MSQFIIGIDEVGRGPLAGPVCAAAAAFLAGGEAPEGLTDSKKLTERQRERVYDALFERVAFGLGRVESTAIDRDGIKVATETAMAQAVEQIASQVPLEEAWIVVDGKVFPEPVARAEGREGTDRLAGEAIPKADGSLAEVAAASVIAKVERDACLRILGDRQPGYRLDKNKGYGTQEHRDAIARLGLSPAHRRTFCHRFLA